MKVKELETLGFTQKPLKNYYGMTVQGYEIILQDLGLGKAGLLLSIAENDQLIRHLDRMQIHSDAIVRSYCRDNECGITLRLSRMTPDELQQLIETLAAFLSSHHIPQVCHLCKQAKPVSVAIVGGELEVLCDDCLHDQEDVKTIHSRPMAGMLGSLLCGLIPALLWALGYRLGYLVAIDGILFALCGYFGYAFFGDGMDGKGRALSLLAIFIDLMVGEYGALALSVKEAYMSQMNVKISLGEALSVVPAFIDQVDIAASILTYLFYGVVLIVVTWLLINVIYSRVQKRKMTLKV